MGEHKLASAADFRNSVKDEDCYEPAREVFLPKCEKWVLLRKPKPLAYTLLGAPLPGVPEEDEAAIGASEPKIPPHFVNPDPNGGNEPQIVTVSEPQRRLSPEEVAQVAGWLKKLWSKVFVHPKLSLKPKADEIHPDWIPKEDQQFVWLWIRGEVNDSGESLSTFPGSVQE